MQARVLALVLELVYSITSMLVLVPVPALVLVRRSVLVLVASTGGLEKAGGTREPRETVGRGDLIYACSRFWTTDFQISTLLIRVSRN